MLAKYGLMRHPARQNPGTSRLLVPTSSSSKQPACSISKETPMSWPTVVRAGAIVVAALFGLTLPGDHAAFPPGAFAQEKKNGGEGEKSETPIGPVWWPSPFGAEDQRGAANRITPERVVAASKLIK